MRKEMIWWGLGVTAVLGAIGVGLYLRFRNHPEDVPPAAEISDAKPDTDAAAYRLPEEKPDLIRYAAALRQTNYTSYADEKPKEEKEELKTADLTNHYPDIFVIRQEDFGQYEDDGYENISLTFFDGDKILVDDTNRKLTDDDISVTIGLDEWRDIQTNPMAFRGEDAIYMRNNTLRCDYEILLDWRRYADVVDYPNGGGGE